MNRLYLTLFLAVCLLLSACSSPEDEEPTEIGVKQEEAPSPVVYQTGVHLQGVYELPDWLQSLEPIETAMNYLLYLPDGYGEDPEKEWPLIVFLHGAGDDDYDSAWVMASGLPEVLLNNDQPENFEFVVLSPQAFYNTSWWNRVTPTVIHAMIDEIIETYNIDTSRVYLTGLSMGGYGSWFIAAARPERFAAMASISGSGFRTTTMPEEEVLCSIEEVPLWAIHGSLDQISNAGAIRAVLQAYEDTCDGEIKITFYPDEGHFGAYYKAYRDPALYDWFLSKNKPQAGAEIGSDAGEPAG